MEIESLKNFLETKSDNFNDIFQKISLEKGVSFHSSTIGIDLTYAYMHLVAQRIIYDIVNKNSSKLSLLDIGSQFSFISFAANFCNVVSLEPRSPSHNIFVPGFFSIEFVKGEAQSMPFPDNLFSIVTSFHAIEHFGLGRYGDTYDYFGDQKGIREFCRVLSPGGFMITGVPASKKSTIEFNGQRKYNPEDFNKMALNDDLELINQYIVYVPGSRADGIVIGNIKTIYEFEESFTPPVLISIFRKKSLEKSALENKNNQDFHDSNIETHSDSNKESTKNYEKMSPEFIEYLEKEFQINVKNYPIFVETGTHLGNTCMRVREIFKEIHTIEISEKYFNIAKSNLESNQISHAVIHLGDSLDLLPEILERTSENAFFWLDGHWSAGDTGRGKKDCPLIEECESISNFCRKLNRRAIVTIDDVRYFGSEGWSDISIELINKIFGDLIFRKSLIEDIYFLDLRPPEEIIT